MNITTLFSTRFNDPLLFNIEGENICESWNATKLFTNVSRVSHALRNNGVSPGDRIIILTDNRAETFEFTLAVFNIGAIAVPVNLHIGNGVLLEIIRETAPKCCFYEGALKDDLIHALMPSCRLFIFLNDSVQSIAAHQLKYADLLAVECPIQFGNISDNSPALFIHTSGSQGRQKVIQMSHGNLFNYFHHHDLVHRQFADNRGAWELQSPIISVFHPGHLAAYSMALQGLLMRRPTYLMRGFSPRAYLRLLSRLRCRLSILVPSMYMNLLKERLVISSHDFTALELCAAVGEPSPDALADMVEQTFKAKYFSGYGLTECLPGIGHTWEDLNHNRIPRGSSGKLLFGEARLVDEEGKDSDLGELWLRNPTVHHCYADPCMNLDKINSDGWFRTGDLFYRDKDGYFFHKGRVDDMLVFNGKNVYPAEIESVLIKYPAIEKAVAVVIMDNHDKFIPAALVETQEDLNETEVFDFFMQAGPLHALPKLIKTTKQLPQLGSGKIDRKECQRVLQETYDLNR